MKGSGAALIGLCICTGCGSADPAERNVDPAVATSTTKPIDGYGELKLGSSFEDVLGVVGGDQFNPYSLKDCFDNLAIRGCFLTQTTEAKIFEFRDGVPYKLQALISPGNKVADLSLVYDREADISSAECARVIGITIDWVEADYGPLRRFLKVDGKEVSRFTTPRGAEFIFKKPAADGSFMLTHLNTQEPERREKKINWPVRNISLFSFFFRINGKPSCHVSVQFSEPSSVPRPPARD